jgi:hypothetical protein
MNESDYHRYIDAFNARDYMAMERFFADDVALENAGFLVRGKTAFREFYGFFHQYCHETVRLLGFYPGSQAFVANVVIRFEGVGDLTPDVLARHGFSGMTPISQGAVVDLEFLILYQLDAEGLIRHIKGAVWVPAKP